jgi:hypothetical protein
MGTWEKKGEYCLKTRGNEKYSLEECEKKC